MKSVGVSWTDSVPESPSTRRVWIEIPITLPPDKSERSHPPHGGCGLKLKRQYVKMIIDMSSSTRIECVVLMSRADK